MKIISKKYIVNFGKKKYIFSTYSFKKSIKVREKVLARHSSPSSLSSLILYS